MLEAKQLIGRMNFDDPPEVIGEGDCYYARNIEWYGTLPNLRPQSARGNTLVPNSFLPDGGVNDCTINATYDSNKHRIFFFNYNSTGKHGIYVYYTLLGTFKVLIQSGTNTDGDILGFLGYPRINSVDIIYGDDYNSTLDIGGDLLCFLDSLRRPTKLNIDRILADKYPVIKREFLEVIKAPPKMPPQCTYENDPTVQSNNLNGCLVQFAASYFYDDYEKSVISGASKLVIPSDIYSPADRNQGLTNNSRIAVYFQTGDINIKKIRLLCRVTQNGATSDWLIVQDFDKNSLGINSNDIYRFQFYNNGVYVTEDITYAVLPYDFVPQQALSQALLDGSVLSYAGITEGYDYPASLITATSSLTPKERILNNGCLFFGSQDASNSVGVAGDEITFYITGTGINDSTTNLPATLIFGSTNPSFYIHAILSNGTDVSFSFMPTVTPVTDPVLGQLYELNISTIITQLGTAAVTAGFTVISSTSNSITIQQPNSILIGTYIDFANSNILAEMNYFGRLAHYPQASYVYGKKYYNKDGITNGVVTNVQATTTTPSVTPQVNATWVSITYSGGTHYFIYSNMYGFYDCSVQPPPFATNVLYSTMTFVASGPADFATYVLAHYFGWAGGIVWTNNNLTISNFPSPPTTSDIPLVTIDLSRDTPPSWAAYYHIVRSDNLTYNKYFQWATNQAFSNVGQLVENQYAYLGITNVQDYNQTLSAASQQSASNVVSYGFAQGDRVRISGRYAVDGTFSQLNFDYAILGLVVDPVINGIAQQGSFLQIAYPTNDISSIFKFDGTPDFQDYVITIYSFKQTQQNATQVYYEIGERYGIIDAGLPTAKHAGNNGINSVLITDGDCFFRYRQIPIGQTYYLYGGNGAFGFLYSTPGVTPALPTTPSTGTITTSNYIIKTQGLAYQHGSTDFTLTGTYPTYNDGDVNALFTNTGAIPQTLRYRETIPITVTGTNSVGFAVYAKIINSSLQIRPVTLLYANQGLVQNTAYNIEIDATFSVNPGEQVYILYSNTEPSGNFHTTNRVVRLDVITNLLLSVFDSSFSDIYTLRTNSDNRPSVQDVTALQSTFDTLFRYSEAFQVGTTINDSNRFYPNNTDEFDKSFGSVQRMTVYQRQLTIWQERNTGIINIYAKFIKDNNGVNTLVTTDAIITPNNIEYYEGGYGIGNQQDCIAVNGYQRYAIDPVKGVSLRLSRDGFTATSELYKTQSYFGTNAPMYLNSYPYPFGGNSVILCCYNFLPDRESEVLYVFQSSNSRVLPSETISFIEQRNAFASLYDINCDAIVCAENTLYTFKNGQMYIRNAGSNGSYATYFGTSYLSQIGIIFNEQTAIKKKYMTLGYQAQGKIWQALNVGDIKTSFYDSQSGLQQISQLINPDFTIDEGNTFGAYLRDANSMSDPRLALLEGNYLEGVWLQILLTAPDNNFNFIHGIYHKYIPSPQTP